jgi:hypothetical protein
MFTVCEKNVPMAENSAPVEGHHANDDIHGQGCQQTSGDPSQGRIFHCCQGVDVSVSVCVFLQYACAYVCIQRYHKVRRRATKSRRTRREGSARVNACMHACLFMHEAYVDMYAYVCASKQSGMTPRSIPIERWRTTHSK